MPTPNFLTQFYVNCAHIEVINTGKVGKNPGPLVKIPGVYFRGQSGVRYFCLHDVLHYANLSVDVYFDAAFDEFDIAKYKAPAPKVWDGN